MNRSEASDDIEEILSFEDFEIDQTLSEYFPDFLPLDQEDTYEVWKEAAEELYQNFPEYLSNKLLLNSIMRTAKLVAFKTPIHRICQIYQDLIHKLLKKYPSILNFMSYEEPECSNFFEQEHLPKFSDIDLYFETRNKFVATICPGIDIDILGVEEIQSNHKLAKLSHTYKNRIMGSMALKRADLEEALIKIFNFFNGVFPNYFKLILYFPEYLINHWNVWTEVVIEDGPLSFEYRLVIGLMVCNLMKCDYMYDLLYSKLKLWGVDLNWIKHPKKHLPKKLGFIRKLVVTMVFRPYDFMDVKKWTGVIGQNCDDSETVNIHEMIHLILLTGLYVEVCTTCLSTGVTNDASLSRDKGLQGVAKPKKRLTVLDKPFKLKQDHAEFSKMIKTKFDELNNEDEPVGGSNKFIKMPTFEDKSENSLSIEKLEGSDYSVRSNFFWDMKKDEMRYSQEHMKHYQKQMTRLVSNEFDLETQGILVLGKFLRTKADIVRKKLQDLKKMTFGKYGHVEEINTKIFRKSIEMYTKLLFGYRHTEFDYSKMNSIFVDEKGNKSKHVARAAKSLIKMIGTSPKIIKIEAYEEFLKHFDFYTHEIIHIILLGGQARAETLQIFTSYYIDKYIGSEGI